jgi:hypothetical protein
MHEAVQSFLNKGTADPTDLLAKRALRAIFGLQGLEENFRVRGIAELLNNVGHSLQVASGGFVLVNISKNYGFAEEVIPGATAFTAEVEGAVQDDHFAMAQEQIEFAEQLLAALSQYYYPVLIIRGVRSVQILLGDFAAAAAAQMKLANDN